MSRLKQLVVEVHRRSIWQVLGIYLVGSWMAYQVTLAIVDGMGLPDWVPAFAIILFVIGLPIVVATAFVQEGLPGATPAPAPSTEERREGEAPVQPVAPPLRQRLTWKRSLSAGVAAFAMLGIGVSGFMGMRAAGLGPFGSLAARGELGDNAILIADFDPITGDSTVARVVGEAFRVDLTQSSLLRGVDRSRIRYTLERMGKPPDTRVANDIAREIALRLGTAVVLEGEVGRAGTGYLITTHLVTPDSGRALVTLRETAADSSDLLGAVDRLSRKLRERAGESLRDIRASQPLAQVTTSSLPALRLYMEARDAVYRGQVDRAIKLHQQAVQLDSTFASAHNALGVLHYNAGQRNDTMLYHFRTAIAQSDRLTERERHHARAMYALATGRWDDARTEFETLVARDSTDAVALINLGVVYGQLGRDQRAEELAHRAELIGFKAIGTTFWNQLMAQLDQNSFDRAQETIARTEQEHPGNERIRMMRTLVYLAARDYVHAEAVLDTFARANTRPGVRRVYLLMRGKRAAAAALRPTSTDIPVDVAWNALFDGYEEMWVMKRPQAAAQTVAAALRHPALDAVPASERPDSYAAVVLAAAGDVRTARALVDRFEAAVPDELRAYHDAALLAARGFIHMREGRPDSAIASLRAAQRIAGCNACIEPWRAQVFEAAGMPDSAAASYERYIDIGWQDRHLLGTNVLPNDAFMLAFAHESAALLYDQLGNREKARSHFASFAELWRDADASLQPRVRSAQLRLEQLTAERGR
jgi:tetratricopeptide (TPR) repeat protein